MRYLNSGVIKNKVPGVCYAYDLVKDYRVPYENMSVGELVDSSLDQIDTVGKISKGIANSQTMTTNQKF